jgi:putative cell wall-binding protein
MVFPDADYYLTAVKEGYENYRSIVISVEEEIVEWNFKLNKPLAGIHRLAGESRVDTALAIAKANYTEKVANAVLATAANYPDALTGSVLAYKLQAPILLVGSNKADQDKVLNYLRENLQADGKVYILGGTGAIPLEVEKAVQRTGFTNITRLSGDNRGKTALAIAERLEVQKGRPVILVNENSYADALAVSSIAAVAQSPILPVGKDRLSAEMKTKLAELNPDRVYLIGGEGVLSPAIVKEIEEITSLNSSRIIRIAGANRYETALAIAQYFNPQGQNVCLATGKNFPDALAGSVYAANFNSLLLLVDGNLSEGIRRFLSGRDITGGAIFGGEEVVGQKIEQELAELLKQ